MSKRKQHPPEFKAKVALDALKGKEAAAELASRFGVRLLPAGDCEANTERLLMIHQWKRA